MTRAVLTIAVGKPVYLAYASNLARSFRHWHPDGDIEFHLVTDQPGELDADLGFVKLHRAEPGSVGRSFTSKLHMGRFLYCDETLFIDADCLCVGHLGEVFHKFSGHSLSVVGAQVSDGDLFGDIASRCRKAGVAWTVRFCGSLYFLRRGALCSEILEFARQLEPQYEELGITKLRGVANEEPLLGLAMGKFAQKPIPEDGTIKADLMFYSARPRVDTLRGTATITNLPDLPVPSPEWNMPGRASPKLVHFNAGWTDDAVYTSETLRLRLIARDHWPAWLATGYVVLLIVLPNAIWLKIKATFRPMYRALFGYRGIQKSERL